jgi:lipopolysaccharide heptosyltransferase II
LNINNFKKLLIIRLSSLGDILLTTPLLRTLKEKYPAIEIDFILKGQFKDVLIQNPDINKLFIYNEEKTVFSLLIKEMKNREYDLIIDLQNNLRSKKIADRFKVKKLKFNKRDLDKFLLVNFKINRLRKAGSIPERYASTFDKFHLDNEGLDLFTNKKSSDLFVKNKKYIGLCPGARHFTKMWPKEYYIRLGNLLMKENYNISLLGGKEDKEICKEISTQIPDSINLSNNDDILQTAADMKKCDAIVCNDSGLMHAACAVKIPVLTFFGSTVKEFGFVPYKNKNTILENNSLPCRPCSHIGKSYCPKSHFKCMLEITPDAAFNKLKFLLRSE